MMVGKLVAERTIYARFDEENCGKHSFIDTFLAY